MLQLHGWSFSTNIKFKLKPSFSYLLQTQINPQTYSIYLAISESLPSSSSSMCSGFLNVFFPFCGLLFEPEVCEKDLRCTRFHELKPREKNPFIDSIVTKALNLLGSNLITLNTANLNSRFHKVLTCDKWARLFLEFKEEPFLSVKKKPDILLFSDRKNLGTKKPLTERTARIPWSDPFLDPFGPVPQGPVTRLTDSSPSNLGSDPSGPITYPPTYSGGHFPAVWYFQLFLRGCVAAPKYSVCSD